MFLFVVHHRRAVTMCHRQQKRRTTEAKIIGDSNHEFELKSRDKRKQEILATAHGNKKLFYMSMLDAKKEAKLFVAG